MCAINGVVSVSPGVTEVVVKTGHVQIETETSLWGNHRRARSVPAGEEGAGWQCQGLP